MFFRQLIDEDLGCASYLIADQGQAAVIDPSWDTRRYLALAEREGLSIDHVLETHTHADHVSGRGRLVEATGAAAHLPASATAEHPFAQLEAGTKVHIGRVVIETLATPGHRPEHVSFLVSDTSRSEAPVLVLSGDSLLVGDVARPDLAANSEDAVIDAARELLSSVEALATLPAHVEVWPGHIGGSLCCGGATDERPSSTIGLERQTNPALTTADPEEFVSLLCTRLPERPPTVERVIALNRGPLLTAGEPLRALGATEVADLLERGASLVDCREALAFDEASVPGSLCLPLESRSVGTRAAWLLPSDGDIVVLGATRVEAEELVLRLAAVGIRNVVGELSGGIRAWRVTGLPLASTSRIDAARASQLLADDEAVLVDVRDEDEWQATHIPGALHIPWRQIPQRRQEALALDKPLVVACASGRRTAAAASALSQGGSPPVLRIAEGGIADVQRYLRAATRNALLLRIAVAADS